MQKKPRADNNLPMKKPELLFIALFLLCGALTYRWITTFQPNLSHRIPPPSEGPRFSEEDGLHFLRQEWWNQIHRTQNDIDWRNVEYQTQWSRFRRQQEALSFRSEECHLNLFDGNLKANWQERGSINQAGSIYQTEYEPERDEIWILSAGGTIWKGNRQETNWAVVNQNLQFDPGLLKFIDYKGQKRLLALISRIPHYSDDQGQNWTPAQGIVFDHGSGQVKDAMVLNNSTIFVLSQPAAGQAVQLHKSSDGGEHFQTISSFPTQDLDQISLFLPFHSPHPYVALKKEDNTLTISQIDPEENTLIELLSEQSLNTGIIPVNLTGWHTDTLSRWYTYIERNNELRLFQTNDQGQNWEDRGLLPAIPWEVGIKGSPSDPDLLFLGEVECFRSRDSGENWEKINPWYAYYNDIDNNLHADIMHFGEFQTTDDTTFMLISHHGGLSYSEDFFITQKNLGQEGLNITQYYDTRTSPGDAKLVFSGSQDQGLQFNTDLTTSGQLPLTQFLPGDYDHLVFSQDGQSLWAVSPGGWVVYLAEANQPEVTATWTLPNFDYAIWLPPIALIPDAEKKQVLFGGGSLREGSGAFLITLEINGDHIRAEEIPFDFFAASEGGGISAVSVCPITNRWYVSTTNGRFFYSNNQGENWFPSQANNQTPLFYNLTILPSRRNSDVIYRAGSGYNQAAIYRSTNGGRNFTPFAEGLPSTVVFDLTANEDETLLFAATQAGPYMYSQAAEKWFDLSVSCTPVQTYLSAEFIPELQTVRFSTFGRGIWDLQLDPTVTTRAQKLEIDLQLFPNPTSGDLQLIFGKDRSHPLRWTLFDNTGQSFQKGFIPAHQNRRKLDLTSLPVGIYFLRLEGEGKMISRRVVKSQ